MSIGGISFSLSQAPQTLRMSHPQAYVDNAYIWIQQMMDKINSAVLGFGSSRTDPGDAGILKLAKTQMAGIETNRVRPASKGHVDANALKAVVATLQRLSPEALSTGAFSGAPGSDRTYLPALKEIDEQLSVALSSNR